jgi:hypothetical protein
MPIRAACPAGHAMMVPDHRAGTRLRCPRCGVELIVPGVAEKKEEPVVEKTETTAPTREIANAADDVQEVPAPLTAAPDPPPANEPPAPPPVSIPAARVEREAWIPPRDQAATALTLSLVLGMLAVFGVTPAVWEWFTLWQNADAPPTPPWVFALLITCVLQIGYAIYLAQAPDWSALWTTTVATLAAAAAWAALLAATLLGKQENSLVVLFRYADKLEGNRAAMWCFIMLCFTSVVAYFLGHTAVRWQRAYRLLRKVREQ